MLLFLVAQSTWKYQENGNAKKDSVDGILAKKVNEKIPESAGGVKKKESILRNDSW